MMLSLLLFILWLLLFGVFARNPRNYYLLVIFLSVLGLGDTLASLPRVFGIVLPLNLLYLQFAILSFALLRAHECDTIRAIRSLGRLPRACATIFGASLLINAIVNIGEFASVFFMLLVYVNIALAYFVAPIVFRGSTDLLHLGRAISLGVMLNLAPTIYQLATGKTFMTFYYDQVTTHFDLEIALPEVLDGVYRLRGYFYGHASFAFAQMTAIPILMLLFVWRSITGTKISIVELSAFGIAVIQLYSTFMRGAWIHVLFIGAAVYVLAVRHKLLPGIIAVCVLFALAMLPETVERFQTADAARIGEDAGGGVTTGRVLLWAQLLPSVESNLLLGNGLGSYERIAKAALAGEFIPSHNDYLMILIECGWLASISYFVLILSLGVGALMRARREKNALLRLAGMTAGLILLAHLAHGFVENLATPLLKWVPVMLLGFASASRCRNGISENGLSTS